ncbi:MAG: hypothetical protein MI739_09820 [Bacteroidales bacterium]|nr:hypothetical protein [Bacteroidales bacterium]
MSFLFLACAIIIAHGIVPHHHHVLHINSCNNTDGHHHHKHSHTSKTFFEEALNHDHDCEEHACHFHIEDLPQISIDKVFIINNNEPLFSILYYVETKKLYYYDILFVDQTLDTNYLRGPPCYIS